MPCGTVVCFTSARSVRIQEVTTGHNRSQHATFDMFFFLQIEQLYCLHQLSLLRQECIACYFGGETVKGDIGKQGLCPFAL